MIFIFIILISIMLFIYTLAISNNIILKITNFFIITIYMLVFTYIYYFTVLKEEHRYIYSFKMNFFDNNNIIVYIGVVLVLFLSINIGYFIIREKKKKVTVNNISSKTFNKAALTLFLISLISYFLYTRAYGGFIKYLDHSFSIRTSTSTIQNKYSFFQIFGKLTIFSSFIYLFLLYDNESNNKQSVKYIKTKFLITFLFSVYILISRAGRLGMLTYFTFIIIIFILMFSKSDKNNKYKIPIVSLGLFIPLFIIINNYLGRDSSYESINSLLLKELTYPFISYANFLEKGSYRYFKDFFQSPFYFLPMSTWSNKFGFESASSYNTFLLSGFRKGEFGVMGTTPVDMLTFSMMQFNVVGVILVGIVFGLVLKKISNIIKNIENSKLKSMILIYVLIIFIIDIIMYSDPLDIIMSNFHIIIGFATIYIYHKIRI